MKQSLTLLAALALAALMATTALAGTTLTYANFPPAKTFPCVQMERWADEVEKRTGGVITIQTFPGSTLLGGKNMLRGVMTGQADIGCLSLPYYPGVFPAMSAVNLPVSFSSTEVASLTMWDLYKKYQPQEFQNVKVLTMFTSAPSHFMSKVPIRSLDDLKGLELRGAGSLVKVIDDLGGIGVGMPMPATPEALQKGVVKGLVSSFDVLKDMNFAELCRYETIANLPVYPFAVIMNKSKWDGLPEEVKKVLDDLGREQAQWTGAYLDNYTSKALAWAKEKYEVEVITLSDADYQTMNAKIAPMIDAWKADAAKKGVDADAVLTDMLTLKKKYEAELGK